MVKTIGMEPVKDFTKYVIYSGFVENKPYPVSGLIIAPPEHGKSTEVEKFECLGAMQIDKTTAYGLADIIQNMTKEEREIYHHFIILDLENYASMGRDVREQFLAFVRQTTQEGIKKYHTFNIHFDLESRQSFGFLMCTTPEDIGDKRSVFRSQSFLSRPLPFTYSYSNDLRMKILEYLMDEEHNEKQAYLLKREEKVDVTLPEKFSSRLNILALILARKVDERASHPKTVFNGESELCGIRAKENLMTFLKSIALYRGRDVVTESDFDELRRLYRFMNFNFRNIDACREEPMKENHSMLKLETIRKRPREGVT